MENEDQTEIQFLVSLLMNHKVADPIKKQLIARIGVVEAKLAKPMGRTVNPMPVVSNPSNQAPSTLAAMARQDQIIAAMPAQLPVEAFAPQTIPVKTAAQRAREALKGQQITTAVGNGTEVSGPRKW